MSDPRCGTEYGYQIHIRTGTEKCAPCRRAHANAEADYRRRRYLHRAPLSVDATGTRRRIQALAAIGWSKSEQSRLLGREEGWANTVSCNSRVTVETAEKVRALYDELSMTLGPCTYARRHAERQGWLPPLSWNDEEIDDPAARPSGVRTDHEPSYMHRDPDVEERVMSLTRAGLSAAQIAVRLRISQRQVVRIRTRNRTEDVA